MIEMGKSKPKKFPRTSSNFFSEFIPLRLVFTSDGVGVGVEVVMRSVELMI